DAEIIAEVEDPQGNGVDVIIEIRSRNQAVPNVRGNTQGGRLHTPSVFQMNPIQGLTAVNSPYPFEILIQPPQGYSINGLLREQIIVNAVPQQGLNVRVRNQGLTIRQGQNAQITVEVLDQNGNGVDNVQLEITAPSQLIPDVGGTTQNGGAHTPSTFPTNPIPNLVTRDSPYSFLVRIVGVPQGFVIPNPINREIIVTGGGGGPHKPGFTKRFLNLLRKDDALSYLLKSSYTRGTHTTKLRQLENYVQSLNITNWNQEDVRKLNQYMTKARNLYADLIALNNEHFTPIKKILIKIEPGLVATHVEKMINDINYLQNNLNLADYNKLITEFYDREQPPSIIRDRLKMMTDTAKLKTQSLEGAIRAVEKLVQKNP
ncbi:MAG: hypothetical protein Q8Q35_02675, partial [Nanoarchaeota archaeon]|nr:hypothetical protein [Nanoarchaeota archaeon]